MFSGEPKPSIELLTRIHRLPFRQLPTAYPWTIPFDSFKSAQLLASSSTRVGSTATRDNLANLSRWCVEIAIHADFSKRPVSGIVWRLLIQFLIAKKKAFCKVKASFLARRSKLKEPSSASYLNACPPGRTPEGDAPVAVLERSNQPLPREHEACAR